jgi:hypothetical protein
MDTLTFKQWLQEVEMTDKKLQTQVATAAKRGIDNDGESAADNVADTVDKLSQQTKNPEQLAALAKASDQVSGRMKKKMKK